MLAVPERLVVEHRDGDVTPGDQVVGQMPADEACATRDQDILHLCSLSLDAGDPPTITGHRPCAGNGRHPRMGPQECRAPHEKMSDPVQPRPRTTKAMALPSADQSLTAPRDLVLHIGSGKTGTSSIQAFLNRNRERLGDLGLLYPQVPGQRRHVRFGLFFRSDEDLEQQASWARQKQSSAEEFRKNFRRDLLEEIERSGKDRVLVSDEALYGSPADALRRLHTFVATIARATRVVVYLRRQDDHLSSRYQQVVKIGEVRRFTERTEQMNSAATYDYHTRLDTWRRLVEPTEFVVRRFERDAFVDGSLYQDFLDATGVDLRASELEQVEPRNESLDAEAVEFLRILNIYRVENEGARPGLINNRRLTARLAESSNGPTLTLPEGQLDSFMALWEKSNEAVARDFLGDETGQLFVSSRRTRNTTTEQRLEPARLDHYLELLELPMPMHDPLRRLAEREARSS